MPASRGLQVFLKLQIAFFSIFVILNALLFINAVPVLHDSHDLDLTHPVYAGAADGQRYWGVAKTLIDDGTFRYAYEPGDLRPLKRGGPIPPIVFAGLMSLSSFEDAPLLIISFQALLLFATSLLSRTLAAPFSISKNLVQGLVLFNPSLIGLVHHAQSEILFLFFFTSVLFFSIRLLTDSHPNRYLFIGMGMCVGLLLLTRPAGLLFVLSLPLVLFGVIYLFHRDFSKAARVLAFQLFPMSLVATLVVAPWSFYNYAEFGTNGFSSSGEPVLKVNHHLLVAISESSKNAWTSRQVAVDLLDQATAKGVSPCCVLSAYSHLASQDEHLSRDQCSSRTLPDDCNSVLSSLHFAAIKGYGLVDWGHALARAWASTFLGGGIFPIARYLGFPVPSNIYYGPDSFVDYLTRPIERYPGYLVLFFIGSAFALVCRVLGLVGLAASIRTPELTPHHLLYLSAIVIFTLTYAFIGVSRFRAHLEPILAVYAVIGFSLLLRSIRASRP